MTAFSNVVASWVSGGEYRVALFELKGVTTNDTLDVGNYFKSVKTAVCIGVTASQLVTNLTSGIAGTVVTVSPASLDLDNVVVVASGASV